MGLVPSDEAEAQRRLAELLAAGHFPQAEREAESWLEDDPNNALAWNLLGLSLFKQGKPAAAAFEAAIRLSPDDPGLLLNLGIELQRNQQADRALACYTRALAAAGDNIEILGRLASAFLGLHRLGDAETCYRRVQALAPGIAEIELNLGNVLQMQGRIDEALACYRQALLWRPGFAQAEYNQGVVLQARGQYGEAADAYRRALACRPDDAAAHLNLGNTLQAMGQLLEAEDCYRRALSFRGDYPEALLGLGNIQQARGQFDAALASFERAIAARPAFPAAYLNLGNTLKALGRLDDAVRHYRLALDIDGDFWVAHSNLLFVQNLMPETRGDTLLADARCFGERVRRSARAATTWANPPDPGRRLRVGFVSGDFRRHPVSYFLESVLAALRQDHADALALFAYSSVRREDELTARLRPLFDSWHGVTGVADEAVAEKVRSDGIDILLDLSGHIEFNRLPVFAWKPAPVQASWLGYQGTTGVAAIDYVIADPWAVLPEDERYLTEKVWRLPETLWCMTPPIDQPVGPLPALASKQFTFGCLNNLDKLNDSVVGVWARILSALPGSRLVLKDKQLAHAATRERIAGLFRRHGVDPRRLLMLGPTSRAEHLATCNRIDIALDPFPYTGATTTVECLWMGVPVLTLAGDRFIARQGVSLLMNAGLPDWIAVDEDDYVAKALAHAADLPRLATLRAGLRAEVLASPLFDARRFATHFTAALRAMWRLWCAGR